MTKSVYGKLGKTFLALLLLGSLASLASAYDCGIADLWWTLNSTTPLESCGGIVTTNNGVTGVAAVWDNGGDFEASDTTPHDVWRGADGAYETSGSRSLGVWFKPETVGIYQMLMVKRYSSDVDLNFMVFVVSANNSVRCTCGSPTLYHVYSSTALAATNWYHVVCSYDSVTGNMSVYINGSLSGSRTGAVCNLTNAGNLTLGCYAGTGATGCEPAAEYYADGVMDEAFYGGLMTPTQVYNIFKYNQETVPSKGCDVTINNATGGHVSSTTPVINYSVSCTDLPTLCRLFLNGTASGDNATAVVNGSFNYITVNSSLADENYSAVVNCSNLTAGWENASAAISFVVDTVSPVVTISSPTTFQKFANTSVNNLNVSANDTYMFNLTCEVLNGTGVTPVAIYINDTGTPPRFELHNEFTSALDFGNYWLNCSAMDSHTGKSWYPDAVIPLPGALIVVAAGVHIEVKWGWNTKPVLMSYEDRIKWAAVAQADDKGKIKEDIIINCATSLYIINNSGYAGHFVCGLMWTDFQDLADRNFDIDVSRLNATAAKVRVQKTHAGNPFEWIILDPAIGGLNLGFSVQNFTINSKPNFTVNATISPALPSEASSLNCSWTLQDFEDSFVYANVTWFVDGALNSSFNVTAINCTNATTCGTNTNVTGIGEGQSWICSVNGYDGLNETGFVNSTAVNVSISKPVITLTMPLNMSYSCVNVTLNFIYSESHPANCTYSLDGAVNVTIPYVNGTILNESAGVHTLVLWCNDTLGGLGFNFTGNYSITTCEWVGGIEFCAIRIDDLVTGYTTAFCAIDNQTLNVYYNKSVCITNSSGGGNCSNYTIQERKFCELGCEYGTSACRVSIFRVEPALAFIVVCVLAFLFAFWAYKEHWVGW